VLVPMTKVRIIGRRERLEEVLEHLYSLRLVELVDVEAEPLPAVDRPSGSEERTERRERLRLLVAELDGLLDLTGGDGAPVAEEIPFEPHEVDPEGVRAEVRALAPRVDELTARIQALFAEEVVVGRYIGLLRHLLEIVPELRLLDTELAALRLGTIALVLNTEDASVVELLREELRGTLGARFLLVSAPVEGGALGCVLIFPLDARAEVHELLGRQRVRQVPLPDAYRDLSLRASVEAMEARLRAHPGEVVAARAELDAVLGAHSAEWSSARDALTARLEQLDAVRWTGATRRAFVAAAWVPRHELARLGDALVGRFGGEVVLEEASAGRRDTSAPVLLRNARPARPFEFLVRLYDDPRARSLDPTGLVALFIPLMFGLMVGDVVYGAVLLAVALVVRARLGARSPVVRDGSLALAAGSVCAIAFGVVYGEALGDLGERAFGMPALWRHRDDADALEPLLLFALAIGTAHVVLGYVLGLWQSWRDRYVRPALAHVGSLLVLAGLFGLAAVATERLPGAALGPAVAVGIVGLVLASAPHGRLGLVLGPLELVGMIGNVLSYLRLAAVGLASVYLAVVANELATVGPIWMGVVVAAFLHALNLALAGFTPAIQALRLQYVEFFSKFFVGGGRAFRPFGARDGSGRAARPAPAAVPTTPVRTGA